MKTSTISFFSYKGGAGRSTLAYNVIPILASEHFKPTKEHPIIVVDTDVDSCGMSYLVNVGKDDITDDNCVQYLLSNGCVERNNKPLSAHPFLGKLCPVGHAYGYPINDAILLLPAKDGKAIAGNDNYSDKNNPFIGKVKSFIRVCSEYGVAAVIFDSAVGNTATANVSNEASDVIVCCMRPTKQFTDGTERFLRSIEHMDGVGKNFTEKNIILVPNAIPRNEITINGDKYPETAFSKIRNNFQNRFNNDYTLHTYHFDMLEKEEFGIPVVDRFMWQEDILFNRNDLDENEKVVLGRYKKLAGIINEVLEEIHEEED